MCKGKEDRSEATLSFPIHNIPKVCYILYILYRDSSHQGENLDRHARLYEGTPKPIRGVGVKSDHPLIADPLYKAPCVISGNVCVQSQEIYVSPFNATLVQALYVRARPQESHNPRLTARLVLYIIIVGTLPPAPIGYYII